MWSPFLIDVRGIWQGLQLSMDTYNECYDNIKLYQNMGTILGLATMQSGGPI